MVNPEARAKIVYERLIYHTNDPGDEGESDMRGPWQTSFGLNSIESQMQGGPGLSIDDIQGTEGLEERGKQDSGQKATTSVFPEALSQTHPSTNSKEEMGHIHRKFASPQRRFEETDAKGNCEPLVS